MIYLCWITGRLPTEPCVRDLSAGQQLLLDYGFRRLEHEQWQRVERTLGTLWEWTDVYNSKTGRPLEEETPVAPDSPDAAAAETAAADSELRLPLSLVLKPELLQLIRKRLRPPAHLRREAMEGSELSKPEFLELFGQAMQAMPTAAAAIQESMKPKTSFARSPGPPPTRPRITRPSPPPTPSASAPATRKPSTPR